MSFVPTARLPSNRHWPRRLLATVALAACLPAFAQRAALTQDIDEPARSPFAVSLVGIIPNAYHALFVVPAGKRYVIQTYTAVCNVAAGHPMTTVTLSGVTAGVPAYLTETAHYFQANGSISGVAVNAYTGSGKGPMYVDPGATVYIEGRDDAGGSETKSCTFNISGYYITLP